MVEYARRNKESLQDEATRRELQALSEAEAYEVAALVCGARLHSASIPVGRKIGFTNKTIWPEYRIDNPIWGYMYSSSVTVKDHPGQARLQLRPSSFRLEPKLEPEIVFGIRKAPKASMSPDELLRCIGWFAHGFELVHSIYPEWRFTASEAIAAGAVHRQLVIGDRAMIPENINHHESEALQQEFRDFHITMYSRGTSRKRDDVEMGTGSGRDVLGSPLNALRHLCELLEAQDLHPRITAGEIITTGTVTRAFDVKQADTWWRSEYQGTSEADTFPTEGAPRGMRMAIFCREKKLDGEEAQKGP